MDTSQISLRIPTTILDSLRTKAAAEYRSLTSLIVATLAASVVPAVEPSKKPGRPRKTAEKTPSATFQEYQKSLADYAPVTTLPSGQTDRDRES
jgi:hypothetical protein